MNILIFVLACILLWCLYGGLLVGAIGVTKESNDPSKNPAVWLMWIATLAIGILLCIGNYKFALLI